MQSAVLGNYNLGTKETIQTIQKIVILPYAVHSIDTGGLRIVMPDLIPLPLSQRVRRTLAKSSSIHLGKSTKMNKAAIQSD